MMPTIWVDFYSISVSPDTRLGWLGSSTKLSYLPTDFYNVKITIYAFRSKPTKNHVCLKNGTIKN
jgi:hypothetical protein